ncbi:MAG: histidinol-phosphatase [Pseudomonadota bacterium]
MSDLTPQALEAFLLELAEVASEHTLPHFRTSLEVANKKGTGFDPVTVADKQAEQAIREKILGAFPDHGILGEEFGSHNHNAEYQWIIDPVDGTRAFICGLPVWGTLIGIYHDNTPLAGIMAQPFTVERFLSNGRESVLFHGGRRAEILTSATTELSAAKLMATTPDMFSAPEFEAFNRLSQACQLTRYGADCYAYCMLAAGAIDLVVESSLHVYDIAALIPIIRNAGGLVTNWRGDDAISGGQVIAAANAEIHGAALEVLARAAE